MSLLNSTVIFLFLTTDFVVFLIFFYYYYFFSPFISFRCCSCCWCGYLLCGCFVSVAQTIVSHFSKAFFVRYITFKLLARPATIHSVESSRERPQYQTIKRPTHKLAWWWSWSWLARPGQTTECRAQHQMRDGGGNELGNCSADAGWRWYFCCCISTIYSVWLKYSLVWRKSGF